VFDLCRTIDGASKSPAASLYMATHIHVRTAISVQSLARFVIVEC
jgi:hypothetical protein